MAEDTPRKGLGRGLSALMGDDSEDYAALDQVKSQKDLPIEFLMPSPFQPRHRFDENGLRDLVASVREHGILQPISGAPSWRHARTAMRFSPGNGAGGRHSKRASPRSRLSSKTSTTRRRSKLRSSKTSSARTSRQSKKARDINGLLMNSITRRSRSPS